MRCVFGETYSVKAVWNASATVEGRGVAGPSEGCRIVGSGVAPASGGGSERLVGLGCSDRPFVALIFWGQTVRRVFSL
jgi:hypothetical protein